MRRVLSVSAAALPERHEDWSGTSDLVHSTVGHWQRGAEGERQTATWSSNYTRTRPVGRAAQDGRAAGALAAALRGQRMAADVSTEVATVTVA